MDVAAVGIRAEYAEVDKASKSLDGLTVSAKKVDAAKDRLAAASARYAIVQANEKSTTAQLASAKAAVTSAEARLASARVRHTQLIRIETAALQTQNNVLAVSARQMAANQRQLTFQLVDIGQALTTLPTMGIFALQNLGFQVAQIGQLYMGQGGFNQAIKDSARQVGVFAARLGPAAVAVGVLALALVGLQHDIEETTGATVSLGNVFVAAMQEIASSVSSVAAPAVAWLREDFSKFTTAIIEDVRVIGDFLINSFEASYNVVTQLWGRLPEVFGYLMYAAAQKALDGLSGLIQRGIESMNEGITRFNRVLGINVPLIDPFEGFRLDNPFAETIGADVDRIISEAFSDSPMTEAFGRIGERAIQLARDVDEASRSLNAYESAVRSIQRATQNLWDQANFFGPEQRYALLEHTKAQQLLNAAMDAGVTITDQVRARIQGLASEYVSATRNLDLLREAQRSYEEIMNYARNTTRGFITDLRSGIEENKGFWNSFADAAINAIDRVSNRLLDQLLDAIFQVNNAGKGLFGSGSGSLLGSITTGISGLFGAGTVGPPMQLAPSFAGGGYTGNGPRSGGLDGQGGFWMVGHPQEHIWDAHRGMGSMPMPANNNYPSAAVDLRISVDQNGNLRAFVEKTSAGVSVRVNEAMAPATVDRSVAATGGAIKSGSMDAQMSSRFGVSQVARAR